MSYSFFLFECARCGKGKVPEEFNRYSAICKKCELVNLIKERKEARGGGKK
jgi:uncharacterized protein (DUF983 family)